MYTQLCDTLSNKLAKSLSSLELRNIFFFAFEFFFSQFIIVSTLKKKIQNIQLETDTPKQREEKKVMNKKKFIFTNTSLWHIFKLRGANMYIKCEAEH